MTGTDITSRPSVLLTGPTRGLGRAVLDVLARHRPAPVLLLAGRDRTAVDTAVTAARTAGAHDAAPLDLDLASLGSTRAAARTVVEQVRAGHRPPLTAVLANAGIQVTDRRRRSADGHELTFAVNVLAQHLLLRELLPALAPGAHVVLVGSGTHWGGWRSMGLVAPPRWEDPVDLARADAGADAGRVVAGQRAYATSKLAVVLLAHAWQRHEGHRLRVNVYDPGLMPGTGLARAMAPWRQWVWRNVLPALRVLPGVTTPAASARHLAALALGRTHPDLRGGYASLGRVTRSSPASYDRDREDRLWQVLEDLTGREATPGPGPVHGVGGVGR
ncbi:SDR family NAD(P)-dependent oxidoreductase [Micromonospora cathayae]|uniref:SDR family NAD(P)-dependent oxidoreductase n=1 Tax=Micromonospora cathayae TaxID=3028804 RepID=A0ABY7ZW24_9ACTN|nr:SDR family NAD(P)-dependent oxidoreductase [Micromonospora sp. HUAS 3]WDZ86228.1 SDR family NAD(P)-dependent oxidoreductase [Micromonospora sp. HUAS 3]